jgi:hypothetical protein
MKALRHFPSIRLLAAGYASLALLLWVAIFDDTVRYILTPVRDGAGGNSVRILLIAAFALLILAILAPVVWHGPRGDRFLALLLAIFPLLVFSVAAWWVLGIVL